MRPVDVKTPTLIGTGPFGYAIENATFRSHENLSVHPFMVDLRFQPSTSLLRQLWNWDFACTLTYLIRSSDEKSSNWTGALSNLCSYHHPVLGCTPLAWLLLHLPWSFSAQFITAIHHVSQSSRSTYGQTWPCYRMSNTWRFCRKRCLKGYGSLLEGIPATQPLKLNCLNNASGLQGLAILFCLTYVHIKGA